MVSSAVEAVMKHLRPLTVLLLAAAMLTAFGPSALWADGPPRVVAPATVELVYDDGELDGSIFPSPGELYLVMQFTAPATLNHLLGFSLCLRRSPLDSGSGNLQAVLYEDSGSGPGELIRSFPVHVANVPFDFGSTSFYDFDVSTQAVDVGQSFYLGVRLDSAQNDLQLCVDQDGKAGDRAIYESTDGVDFVQIVDGPPFPHFAALMVRATVDDVPTGACDAGDDAVLLLDGRFRVDACWSTANASGTAKLASLDGTGATLWFFDPDNPELFVKVRDACVDPFDRFWVFAAGLTNVEVTVTVTDTLAGASKTYFTPLGTAFRSVQDTESFDTCF
jgi:hypothetical protein